MSRFNYAMTPQKIDAWIKAGRGSGSGKNYKPWLTVFDLASRGDSRRKNGIKIDRVYETFSKGEADCLDIFQLSDPIVDVREQFPLFPLEETETISGMLGIKHPTDPKTGCHIVMTTDFNLTVSDGKQEKNVIRTIKQKSDLINHRTLEKLEIERRYYKSRNMDWGIIISDDIPRILAANCHVFVDYFLFSDLQINQSDLLDIYNALTPQVNKKAIELRLLAKECDKQLGLEISTSLKAAIHFIAIKKWKINWNIPFEPGNILIFINLDKSATPSDSGGIQ